MLSISYLGARAIHMRNISIQSSVLLDSSKAFRRSVSFIHVGELKRERHTHATTTPTTTLFCRICVDYHLKLRIAIIFGV